MKEGTARNLTRTSNAHERDAVWSPDGKWIAYNSDATGENELYVRSQDGKGQPQQITSNADTYYYQAIWSPDSKKLLWGDRLQRLRYVDVASKAVTQVDQDKEGEIAGTIGRPTANGSPGRAPRRTACDKVYLFSTTDKKTTAVTDDWYSADNATFSDDGKYLMLTSSRDFKPIFGQVDFSNVYRDLERVYLVTLAKDTESPLGPRSDEVGKKKDKDKDKETRRIDKKDADKKADDKKADDKKGDDDDKDKDKDAKKPVVVKVDLDGIQERLAALGNSAWQLQQPPAGR